MDQQQRNELRAKWLAKEKNKKYFIIASAICLIVLLIVFVAWWNLLPLLNNSGKEQEKPSSANNSSGTTTVYGVKMQNECFAKFQDFIKTYGQDYSKCLADFDFNEDYCAGFDPDTKGLSDVNIIVILDSSGSMAETINSQPKIDIAKKAVSDFLTKMPPGVNTGLVVYGHKGSNSVADKDLSCKGIEEVVKLGANNSSNIISAMDSFSPKGWTPIAGSFDFVKNIFNNKGTNNKNYLVLVSDGIESCDGNPLAAAEDLKSAIPGIKLDVIGFTADSKTQEYLEGIATLVGGSYLTASNSSGIAKAFNDELLLIKKDCINFTLFQISSRYNTNNLNNLNCWLAAYKKESDDFTINVVNKSVAPECNLEISKALQARQNEFWYEKESLKEKDDAIYKKIEFDFNNKLNALENSGNNY